MAVKTLKVARKVWVSKGTESKPTKSKMGWWWFMENWWIWERHDDEDKIGISSFVVKEGEQVKGYKEEEIVVEDDEKEWKG